MKISVKRDVLVKAVNDVSKAVSTKTTLPILTGIKLETVKNGLSLKGSDNDLSIEKLIPLEENDSVLVEIEAQGAIVLQGKLFSEIVRKLPTDDVSIEVSSNYTAVITSGKAEFRIMGWDPSEFPKFPTIDSENTLTMSPKSLKETISGTIFAAADSEARPVLTGVNWQVVDGTLVCTATDSHRLSKRNVGITSTTVTELNATVPKKSLSEISKLLDEGSEDDVVISFNSNQVAFQFGNIVIFSRLLEGNYPDVSRLIPSDALTTIQIQKRSFIDAIERAGLLTSSSNNHVIKFSTKENGVVGIETSSPEIGKVHEEVEITSLTGEEIKIAFSGKYMKEALRALSGDEITLYFGGAMRPFLIKPIDDTLALQLILPVRTA